MSGKFNPFRDWPAKSDPRHLTAEQEAAAIFPDVCQILDVVKIEWGDSWSEWDQSVRDRITAWQTKHGPLSKGYLKAEGRS